MQGGYRSWGRGRGEKSLLCDPGSEIRLGGRGSRTRKANKKNGTDLKPNTHTESTFTKKKKVEERAVVGQIPGGIYMEISLVH